MESLGMHKRLTLAGATTYPVRRCAVSSPGGFTLRMTVATIVLNWNGKAHLQACLGDLVGQDYPSHRVVVVDNGSEDGSQFWLRGAYPQIELIENFRNVGFAEGNNVGVRRVLADPDTRYITLVNNDTRIPPAWLSALVDALETHPDYWAAQTPLVFAKDPDVINSLGIAIEPSLWAFDDGCMERDPGRFAESEIFGVTAGAAVFRREAIEALLVDGNLFDPRFFAYYEDVDLAFRARLRGLRALMVPHPPVMHEGSATGGKAVGRKVFLLERNHWLYVLKNIPAGVFWKRILPFLAKRVSRMAQWVRPGSLRVLLASIAGNLAWIGWLPYLLSARWRNLRLSSRSNFAQALELRSGASERARV